MEIIIKPLAVTQLKKHEFKEDEGVRIEAIFVGNCSVYAVHNLKIEKRNANDDLFEVEGIPV